MANGRRWKKSMMFRLGTNAHSDLTWAVEEPESTSGMVESVVGKTGRSRRSRWQSGVSFASSTSQKRVSNRWLSQSLMSSVNSSGDVRVRDSFGTSLVQRKKLGMMYGFGVKFPHSTMEELLSRASSGQKFRTTLFAPFELQLNIVRWRSGLVKSTAMADDRIVSGRIVVHEKGRPSYVAMYPMARMRAGVTVQIDPEVWRTLSKEMLVYWSNPLNVRSIPPYLDVSFHVGAVSIVWVARNRELLMPDNMSFSLKSFYAG